MFKKRKIFGTNFWHDKIIWPYMAKKISWF